MLKLLKTNSQRCIFAPLISVILNLIIAFAVYFIARIEFLLENHSYFSEGISTSNLVSIFFWRIYLRSFCDSIYQYFLHCFDALPSMDKRM